MNVRLRLAFGGSAFAAAIMTGLNSLDGAEITLPVETARLARSPLAGYEFAVTYCFTCHSTDYVQYQPSMTRAAWKASVVKMQKTFGAVIPESAVEPIAEYLAKTYGAERSDASRPTVPPDAKPKNGDAGGRKS